MVDADTVAGHACWAALTGKDSLQCEPFTLEAVLWGVVVEWLEWLHRLETSLMLVSDIPRTAAWRRPALGKSLVTLARAITVVTRLGATTHEDRSPL